MQQIFICIFIYNLHIFLYKKRNGFSFLEFSLDLNDRKLFLLCHIYYYVIFIFIILLLNYFSYIYIHIYNNNYILLTGKIFYIICLSLYFMKSYLYHYVLVAFLVISLFFFS